MKYEYFANPSSTVTINSNTNNYRRGDYFQKALDINNSTTNPAVLGVSVTAGGTPQLGKLILPPATQTFLYDSDGNLTNDLVWQYQWDAENRLIQMDNMPSPGMNSTNRLQLKFEYDWQGRRIMKTVTRLDTSAVILANKFLYNGWNLIAELNATNNTVIRSYVWGSDLSGTLRGAGGVGGLLMVKNGTTETHFASYDLNGNLTGLINGTTGAWSANYEYSPFGELIRATGPMAKVNPLRWSSKYTDDETDLVYYGYRFYSPGLGRWLSKDRIGERGGLNLYGFARNDPMMFVDPFGNDYYLGGESGMYAPGPLGYLYGDSYWEQFTAGFYNTVPEMGNILLNSTQGMMLLASILNQNTENFLSWLSGDQQVGQGLNNALAVTPLGWPERMGKIAVLSTAISRCEKTATGVLEAERGGLNLFKWKHRTSATSMGWKEGDYFLHLPNQGSAQANWIQNFRRLREEMRKGKPIYDSYRDASGQLIPTKGFLNAERTILIDRGWEYNASTGAWHPPVGN